MLLTAALVTSELAYVLMARLDSANGWRPVGAFLGLFAFLFASYAAAHAGARRAGGGALPLIAMGAVLFRVTLLPAGLPGDGRRVAADLRADLAGERVAYDRFLLFDADVWRYLWDGHVWAHGVNPYSHPPAATALDALGDAEPGPVTDGRAIWSDVRDNVGYPDVPTIYPPFAQALFRTSHAVAPGSILAIKSLLTLVDLAAAVLVALALRAAGRPVTDVLLYAWNPLVVKAFAGSGHVDALLVAALAGMAYAAARKTRLGLAAAFALAVLAKLSPLILAPLVARRVGIPTLLASLAVVMAAFAPFADAGTGVFAGLAVFARDWEFNAGPFSVLRAALTATVSDADATGRLLAGAVAAGIAVWLAYRDGVHPERFAGCAAATLGVMLLFSPTVMPWYATWLLPLAVVAGQREWLVLSGLVGFAFVVMVDGRERVVVLAVEYGLFAVALVWFDGGQLRSAAPFAGGACMRWMKTLGLAALLGALPASSWGQGSGTVGGSMPGNFGVFRQVDGTLVSVDEKERVITIEEKKNGKRWTLHADPKIKLTADKNSALEGRRDLTLSSFTAGQPVRVSFRASDQTAVEMKLKKPER